MDKQIIDENKINPNDWLEPYKPIPACEIKDCDHLVYAGNDVYGCRIAEDGLVCDDFNNDDECCMYRQLEYYKEALKNKEQECEELKEQLDKELQWHKSADEIDMINHEYAYNLKAENEDLKKNIEICWENLKISEENKKIQHEHWFQRCSEIQAKANDFEQTLAKIKEIAEQMNNECFYDDFDCKDCDMKKGCPHFNKKEILQKISEVEDEKA